MEDKKLDKNLFWVVWKGMGDILRNRVEQPAADNSTISQISTNLKMSMGTVVWLWNGWIHAE